MSDEMGLFEIEEDSTPTPGQRANALFREWYQPFYKGNYVQNVGHIMRVLTQAVKNNVDEAELREALKRLGKARQQVTERSLQIALVQARAYLQSNVQRTGMNIEAVEDFDPTDPNNY